ncbi:hypothetical protein pipiens_012665 [Culex pipiens pipiens]|uniref:Ionotropic receptor n=1 Tax=Culex pipiens pipiens TaxID=38569 RepID=A0ABD1D1E1_CULPP
MKSTRLLSLWLLSVSLLGYSLARTSLTDFVLYLIKHRVGTVAGVPKVVFYGLSPQYPLSGVLGEVIRSPKLDHVSKLVITRDMPQQDLPPFEPTLLILHGNVSSFFDGCMDVLRMIIPYTRVIVLTRYPSRELRNYAEILQALDFYHVYFLDGVRKVQIWLDVFTKYFEREIFGPRHYRNLRGKPVTALMYKDQSFSTLVLHWFSETAHLMNSTFERYPHKNDPFLLIICGFERRDLNKSKTLEIFILHSMMIVMFFVFSAYETILLSWMTKSPSSHRLRTLADLVESGIKIKSDLVTHNNLINHSIVGDILVNSTESVRNMDYVHAHIVGRETAERMIPRYYDPVQKLYRYTILDQPFSMFIQSYRFKFRSPLMEGFTRTMFVFFESGISKQWNAPLNWRTERYIGEDVYDDDDLHFSDLMPIWAALLLGDTTDVICTRDLLAIVSSIDIICTRDHLTTISSGSHHPGVPEKDVTTA